MGEMLKASLEIALDQLAENGILNDYNLVLDVYDGQVSYSMLFTISSYISMSVFLLSTVHQ